MERIAIRRLNANDVDAVLAIQAASPEAAAWNRQAYKAILDGSTAIRCLVAAWEGQAAGFACLRAIEREGELLNIAVLPHLRRLGIAARLLEAIISELAAIGVTDIFLEVRDSNLAALGLYRRFGFELYHRRPGYYSNPSADALTLRRRIALPEKLI